MTLISVNMLLEQPNNSLLSTITVTDFIPKILKYHSSSEDVLIHT